MEITKQKFTIEIERPTMDCKVTESELYKNTFRDINDSSIGCRLRDRNVLYSFIS